MTTEVGKIPTLFISYSHKDEEWKDRLVSHLGVLRYEGLLDLWDDRRINVGDDWNQSIQDALNNATVAVLLISANFLTSKFILGEEVPRLLKRRAEENLRVFPVVTRPCAWQRVSWLQQMQLRPLGARALSAGSENQIDTDLAAIADEIFRLTQGAELTVQEPTQAQAPAKVSLSRMPVTSQYLFGRDKELTLLDEAWKDPEINIVSVIAWGGVGKSALINHWLRRMAKEQYRGAERVYAWSFYRQGTSERVISADEFIASALAWFDDPDPSKGNAWDKGERLASLIRKHRTLLLLDGLEPLQVPPGQGEGKLRDHALRALLRELATSNQGLCVISTRISVADLEDLEESTVRPINLELLSPQAGAQLLRAHGVNGEEDELQKVAQEYQGHSLALTLLGSYLKDVFDGNIHHLDEVDNLEKDSRYGVHAERVMSAYEKWFGDGAEVSVLRLLGFFDRPADEKAIAALRSPVIPGLTDKLHDLTRNEWRQVLSKLRRAKLLAEVGPGEAEMLDSHPLVREHFGREVKMKTPEAWRAGNDRLYEHFKLEAKEFPDTLQEMEPLFRAVIYGCNAGRHRDALHEVYLPRIMRGNESYAAKKLGAHGALLSTLVSFMQDGDWSKPVAPNLPTCQGLEPSDQLTILAQAGLYLTATKGFASSAVMACYERVQELCKELGETPLLYSVLISQWRYSLVANDLTITLQLAKKLYNLAQTKKDPGLLLGAYRSLTTTVYFRGNFELARKYAKEGIDLWDPKRAATVEEYYAPIVTCLVIDALALWQLGKPDQAQKRAAKAIKIARELSDMTALAAVLFLTSYLNQFCRRTQATLESSHEVIELSSRQGFAFWLANGRVLHGWALATGGAADAGMALMNRGLQSWRDAGAGLNVAYFLALQAEIVGNAGQTSKALSLLDQAQSFADKFNEHWWMAEIYRLKGEMLLRENTTTAEGESQLNLALGVAQSQHAKSLELRTSLSLFRLWQSQGKSREGRALLERIYASFKEGMDCPDLQEAASYLKETTN